MWVRVPAIWNQIEKTKTKEELWKILVKKWHRMQGDLNVMVYEVEWEKGLLKAVRTKTFTSGAMHGSFLTSKSGISILNFMKMQWDQVKIDALTLERELKK